MRTATRLATHVFVLAALGGALPAAAQDKLKVAVGQRGVWENSISELGNDIGINSRNEFLKTGVKKKN